MNVRCTSEGDGAELCKGNELSIARAVDSFEVLDDPFSVLLAESCLAAESVRDGFAGGLVRDVAVGC